MANIMIQGTTSSAGKSLLCAGLCRIFKEDGFSVCPFKSQNMSSSYYINEEGHKISASQSLQALACGLLPQADMNPILLIPKTNKGSRVVIKGREKEEMEAVDYFKFRPSLKKMIQDTYKKLQASYEIVVIEGAGSPAEINLKENDIVNMGMAEMADAPVLLVADIDRGGVFASFYGTVMLLEPQERARIKGLIINKFLGDKDLLDPGIQMIEDLLNIPVIGTIPYLCLEFEEKKDLATRRPPSMDLGSPQKIEKEFDKLTLSLRENMDMDYVYKIMGLEGPVR